MLSHFIVIHGQVADHQRVIFNIKVHSPVSTQSLSDICVIDGEFLRILKPYKNKIPGDQVHLLW